MTEFTIKLDDPQQTGDLVQNLRSLDWGHVADQIENQLPKPVPEEPTGDVVVAAESGWFFTPGGDLGWVRDDLKPYDWIGVCEFGSLKVYRRQPQPVEELVGVLSPDGPWIPASKVREVAAKMRGDASTGWASGTLGRDLWEAAARRVEALLPEEGQ